MKLYNYFRSSSSYRVRIACNLKGLPYEYRPIHLNRNGGEQFGVHFSTLSPQQLVPVLDDDGLRIAQSLAILEYLEERYPIPPLLPSSVAGRARVREMSLYIACEMHPLNNLRVLKFLTRELGMSDAQKQAWIVHWLQTGLTALERDLGGAETRGTFCFGDTPTMADCCLVPQLFNVRRFGLDVDQYPTLRAIERQCEEQGAFDSAHPSRQSDVE
ncbi:maleylacetoacetate isomerase [Caballeronia sp. KNU42]